MRDLSQGPSPLLTDGLTQFCPAVGLVRPGEHRTSQVLPLISVSTNRTKAYPAQIQTGNSLVTLPELTLIFAEVAWAFHSPCEAGKILAHLGVLCIDPPLPWQTVPSTDGLPMSWQHLSPVIVGFVVAVVPPAVRIHVKQLVGHL